MSPEVSHRRTIRSYQRIFAPDRRIYQVEGYRLPIPGGIPLAWVGYATATLLLVLLLVGRSPVLGALAAAAAGGFGAAVGDQRLALVAAVSAFGAMQGVGWLLGALDWPLRLLVLPGLVATLATQATPDGRPAHRYALSWLVLQLRPTRRWLGGPLPVDERRVLSGSVGIRPDHRSPQLRRARITGPAIVAPAHPVALRIGRRPWNRRTGTVAPLRSARRPAGELHGRLELGRGERLEVRP